MKVIINRKRWLRGESGDYSFLLREHDKKMCCLGFACLKAGAKRKDILNESRPRDLIKNPLAMSDPETISKLMIFNDDVNINDEIREKNIIKLGKKINIDFQFIN